MYSSEEEGEERGENTKLPDSLNKSCDLRVVE